MIGPRQIARKLRPRAIPGMRPRRRKPYPFVALTRAKKIYGGIGMLQVRLARSHWDVRRAQRLRYTVFYEEMSARATGRNKRRRRDEDAYDAVCDHLLVTDHAGARRMPGLPPGPGRVVGTYRLLRQQAAEQRLGFYTQGEFDIAPLIAAKPALKFVELGRSCVLAPYRDKRTLELLWHGLWTYVREHRMDVMIGCASFPGTDPEIHAQALSFLAQTATAPPEWYVRPHPDQRVEMARLPPEQINAKAALRALPPLIKGYLRAGAFVGDGAVIDNQFGTVDVVMIMPVALINPRYFAHFGRPGEAVSAVAQAQPAR